MNSAERRGGARDNAIPGGRPPGRHAGNLPREGGRPCLDFINTLDWRGTPTPQEYLLDYGALLDWSVAVGLLAPEAAGPLRETAARRPDSARGIVTEAVALREAILRLLTAAAQGAPGTEDDRARLNAALAEGSGSWELAPGPHGWRWVPLEQSPGPLDMAGLLRPIAVSAAELLASPEVVRVKGCGDAACGWVFLDTSRNGTRRWCNMASCGNRAKARRHYRRHKGGGAGQ